MILDKVFKLSQNNTDMKTEVRAGLTTFLAMVYIVPVNAALMSLAGMPYDAVITATAVVTMIATLLNAFISNTPVAMSVGMSLNAYFVFGLVKKIGLSWQESLYIVMISGVVFLFLSLTPLRTWLIKSIPDDLKRAISAGIGFFIVFIGLRGMGFVVGNSATLVELGNLKSSSTLLGVLTFFSAAFLYAKKIKGAFLLSILFTSIIAWVLGIVEFPTAFITAPASMAPVAFKLNLSSTLVFSLIPVIITLLITDMFDSVGTLAGVGMRANLFTNDAKKLQKTLTADAFATITGALLGTSTTTSFIESAAGVEEGGRTGLTSLTTGLLFITTIFFLPLFKAIPSSAIYAILIMVGLLMFSEVQYINFKDPTLTVSSFLIILLIPFTYSITVGLSSGFVAYFILALLQRDKKKINMGTFLFFLIGLMGFIFH